MNGAERELTALDEPLLDAKEAAVLLRVRPSWVRDATRAHQLPCVRVGRHVRYERSALREYVNAHREWGKTA